VTVDSAVEQVAHVLQMRNGQKDSVLANTGFNRPTWRAQLLVRTWNCGALRSAIRSTAMQRRKLKMKATLESGPSYHRALVLALSTRFSWVQPAPLHRDIRGVIEVDEVGSFVEPPWLEQGPGRYCSAISSTRIPSPPVLGQLTHHFYLNHIPDEGD